MKEKIKKLQQELKKAKSELWLLHEISNAMRTTLNLPEVLYVILSAVTSQEGLGFNRAMLFLVNKNRSLLEGVMAIGPSNPEEAYTIWKKIEEEQLSLDKIVDMFHRIESHVVKSPLNTNVKKIKLPLSDHGSILTMCALESMNFEATTASIAPLQDASSDISTHEQIRSALLDAGPPMSKSTTLGSWRLPSRHL